MGQEVRECAYGWNTESCGCRGLGLDVEVTSLVDPDLCPDCYRAREAKICDNYDAKINACREHIDSYRGFLQLLGRNDPPISSLIVRMEKDLIELKEGREKSLKIFRDSQGVWVSRRAFSPRLSTFHRRLYGEWCHYSEVEVLTLRYY